MAADAELRAPDPVARRQLLQIPTALSISDTEVSELIEAGRVVLAHSPGFQALCRSLGLAAH